MFNKKDYKAAFSQVKASEDTYQEVLNMAKEKKKSHERSLTRVLVVAAIVSVLAVTASASEYVQNWFASYFSDRSDTSLSAQQIEYIEENEQVVGESRTQNGWTVELRSVLHDEYAGYIIIGITAPDGVDLEPECDEDGNRLESFTPGNGGMVGGMAGAPDIFTAPIGVAWHNWSYSWEEDGDGLNNTKNFVIHLYPNQERCTIDPFGSEAKYYIYMENIVREYEDEAYRQELMSGKYAGQTDIMFTDEETRRLHCAEVLAEGIWDFSITFAEDNANSSTAQQIELLTEPVSALANVFRQIGPEITDYIHVDEAVTLTSVVLRPLTVTLYYEDCDGTPNFAATGEDLDRHVYVILKDGSQIELLPYGSSGAGYVTLEAEAPIVFEEFDHILMADGTIIPMPDLTAE